MEDFKKFVRLAIKQGASDLHLVAGALPTLRVHRKLVTLKKEPLSLDEVQKMVTALLGQTQLKELGVSGDLDIGVSVEDVGLRVNIHKQMNGLGLAIRVIASKIPTPEELQFPDSLKQVADLTDGLVIVSGPTGSGKSTTLAAMIEQMNQKSTRHILTLEDPIEYRFHASQCLIEQRQLGVDFPSFEKGLRHILRQDPDVIVVGEMRDPETIALALTAAETGHLVLSTLHAPNASEAIERMVNVFEGAVQRQILLQLSATLRVIAAQRLLPGKAGGMVAAREILISTTAIRSAIQSNNLSSMKSAIQTGKRYGMISMERAIEDLQKAGAI
ncbi:PilT/PilU family type 4a pilus ATPase [Candidatus Uhrbacteria bacterium]|nr:PilT/PilU family type 4a pilus ATPase [Candidatus Uhrbacteria bacterium]